MPETARPLAHADLLLDLALLVNERQEVAPMFAAFAGRLLEAAPFDATTLLAAERGGAQFRVVASHSGGTEVVPAGTVFSAEEAGLHLLLARPAGTRYVPAKGAAPRATELADHGFAHGWAMALVDAGEVHGILNVLRTGEAPFTADETVFLTAAGRLLGQAIANTRRHERLQSAVARATVLSEIGQLLWGGAPLEHVFGRVAGLLSAALRLDHVTLALPSGEPGAFYHYSSTPLSLPPGEFRPGPAFASMLASSRRVFAWSTGLEDGPMAHALAAAGYQCAASALLRLPEGVTGVLVAARREDRPFEPGDLEFLDLAAAGIAQADRNYRQELERRAQAARDRVLTELALLVNNGQPIETHFHTLSRQLLDGEFGLTFCAMAARAPLGDRYRVFRSGVPPGKHDETIDVSRLWEVIERRGIAQTSVQFDCLPEALGAPGEGLLRAASVPLFAGTQHLGLFTVARPAGREFSAGELASLELGATLLAYAIANERRIAGRLAEADEQLIVAEAAAAITRSSSPQEIVAGLARAAARFVDAPFVQFGFLEDGGVVFFPDCGDGDLYAETGPFFTQALEQGQVAVPASVVLTPGDDDLSRMAALGLRGHIVTRANSGGLPVGLLVVGSRDESFEPGGRDRRLCALLADLAGPAMANVRAAERARQEAADQSILARAAAVAAREGTERGILDGLQRPLASIIPEPVVEFGFVDGDTLAFQPAAYGQMHIPAGEYIARAKAAGQWHADALPPDIKARELLVVLGVNAISYTAARAAGETFGYLAVGSRDPEFRWHDRELRLLQGLAQVVGPALQNARAAQIAREDAVEQRFLAETAALISHASDLQGLVRAVVRPMKQLVPGCILDLLLLDGDTLRSTVTGDPIELSALYRTALDEGQIWGRAGLDQLSDSMEALRAATGTQAWVDTRLVSAGETLGILAVASREDYAFSARELRLHRLVAGLAAPALANILHNRRLQEEAEDQQVFAEAAAAVARLAQPSEIRRAIQEVIARRVPDARVLYGRIDGDELDYSIIRDQRRWFPESTGARFPLSPAGLRARDEGQAVGHTRDLTRVSGEAGNFGEFVLTTYYAAGAPHGILSVTSPDPAYRFGPRERALLVRATQLVGSVIEAAIAEEERARQAELYSLMLRALSEAVIVGDADGHVVFANALGEKVARSLDFLDPSGGGLVPDADIAADTRLALQGAFGRRAASRGRSTLTIDGVPRHFDYEMVPLEDPQMRVLFVGTDVTAEVEREAEQQRSRAQMEQASRLAALGEMVGGVAHELNNPLTAILGFAEVLSMEGDGASEEIEIIRKEALRARNIVRDLLFIARPAASEYHPVCLADVVGHVERLRRRPWVQRGISVRLDVDPEAVVWGNESQLTQVLLNLVTNAEHALEGRPAPSLSISSEARQGFQRLVVADTGTGMDEATRRRIFEPFFTTKQGQGTGLGLALSYSIITAHGGQIEVSSEPGAGATFVLTLPTEAAPAPEAEDPTPADPARVLSVLLVDDEASVRRVVERLVTRLGHSCVPVSNSDEAARAAAGRAFDVVICDYRLGAETAHTAVEALAGAAPGLLQRTIIATGATTDPGVVDLVTRRGLRLMAKPFGAQELERIFAEELARPAP